MTILYFLFAFLIFKINCEEPKVTRPIINKCCALGKYVTIHDKPPFKRCTNYEEASNFTDVVIYDKTLKSTNESLGTVFDFLPGTFNNRTIRRYSKDIKKHISNVNLYLTKEGVLISEIPNIYNRFFSTQTDNFCIDYTKTNDVGTVPRFWIRFDTLPSTLINHGNLPPTATLVSSVLLLIVLIVYALLPELRNLCGLILMAHVSSLLVAFALVSTIRFKILSYNMCIHFTCATYFFYLATFCWLNVMSFDIWWTFRGYAKERPIHRRVEWLKFSMYSIYGYGLPLAMTIFLRVINDVDLTHVPWFIKPNVPRLGCFIQGGQKLLYLDIPAIILILTNWIFYSMTAFNVWRLSRGTAVLNSDAAGTPVAHRTLIQRLTLFK